MAAQPGVNEWMGVAVAGDGSVRLAGYNRTGWRIASFQNEPLVKIQTDPTYGSNGKINGSVTSYFDASNKLVRRFTQRNDGSSWIERTEMFSDKRWDWSEKRYAGVFDQDRNKTLEVWSGFSIYSDTEMHQPLQVHTENLFPVPGYHLATTYDTVYTYATNGSLIRVVLTTVRYNLAGGVESSISSEIPIAPQVFPQPKPELSKKATKKTGTKTPRT